MASTESTASTPSLEARDIRAGYGRVPVLNGISLSVASGEIVVLLGANGAGKTTTLRALSGEIKLQKGTVLRRGVETSSPMHQRVKGGLAYILEERQVFAGLTTADNLRVGLGHADRALELMPELRPLLRRRAGMLSGGEQRMLAVGRALACEPDVILADELSLGLAPLIVTRLLSTLRSAAFRGVGVLLVEQHVRKALAVADRGYVLRRGRVVLEGSARDLLSQLDDIEHTYLTMTNTD